MYEYCTKYSYSIRTTTPFFSSISLVCFVGRGAGTDCSVLSTEAQTPVWKAATDQWAAARHAPPQMKISFHCRRGSPSHPILVPILYETKCSYKVQTTFLHEHRPSCLLRTSCLRPQTLDKNKLLVAFCTPEFHLSTGSEPTDWAAISTCSIIGEEVPEHNNPVLTGRQGERSYCSTPLILACLILLHALPAVSTAVRMRRDELPVPYRANWHGGLCCLVGHHISAADAPVHPSVRVPRRLVVVLIGPVSSLGAGRDATRECRALRPDRVP